ncbi:MAG: CDP-glycerol glycerophosphotransferase family protein [Steroidobacteraceae bacterium]
MNNGPGRLKATCRWIAAYFFRICDHLVPKDGDIVLVTLPDGDDQGVSLCLALMRAHWQGRIHWLVHQDPAPFAEWQRRRGLNGAAIRFSRLYSLRGIWAYLRAGCVFYTHGALFNYAPPKRKLVVNLWHGMPVKKIWRGVPGSELPMSTFLVSTSVFFSDVLMKASGFGPERLLATGLPRNDFLTAVRPESVEIVARLRGEAERLIFFLPTYRNSARGFKTQDGTETHSILGLTADDAAQLHSWLKENRCKLIVKPHPMSINAGKKFADDAQWAMIDEQALFNEGLGLYELLAQADLLVTDVSSVYVDFLITERPQILYFPDLERYEKTRGLMLHPLKDYAPGPIAQDFAELRASLDRWASGEDSWRERRRRLRDLMVPASPQPAAESILAAVGICPQ